MSPFGVLHEPLSKSFTRNAPKLTRALNSMSEPAATDTLGQRMGYNYAKWRSETGEAGKLVRQTVQAEKSGNLRTRVQARRDRASVKRQGKRWKDHSNAAVSGASAANRSSRVLP